MTQAAGEVLQGFSHGLTMFFPHYPALVLYSTGSFRVSVTSIRSPSRQISMVT